MAVPDWHARLAGGIPSHYTPVRRFQPTDGRIDQPALRDHVLAVHLGGPKRVTRFRGRHREVFDVAEGAATLMPAHQSFRWSTDGPIDFAHITLRHDLLASSAADRHDLDLNRIELREQVGLTHPLLVELLRALLAEAQRRHPFGLYCDSLLAALNGHLLSHHTSRGERPSPAVRRGGLAGWQLRRVFDHMHTHLADDIRLPEIIALTGLSRSQFFHAFTCSTGSSPHLYLTNLRVRQAELLLRSTDLPIDRLALAVGLSRGQLAAAFRQRLGVPPGRYRRQFGQPPGCRG